MTLSSAECCRARQQQQAAYQRPPLLARLAVQGQLLLLVMQYMPGGSLFAALQSPNPLEELRWAAR